ncbi:protein of unknown function [Petrocella atlantisensis]|uniref:Uncharacterized protein n=1 Tax=Petrocella atlantisensis TaxID=2173034 RepID=A0A3P7P359_9FIRM|nr:protein of unknown function [Petrocella atlantisensis]
MFTHSFRSFLSAMIILKMQLKSECTHLPFRHYDGIKLGCNTLKNY